MLWLVPALPLLGAAAIVLTHRWGRIVGWIGPAAALASAALAILVRSAPAVRWHWTGPLGLSLEAVGFARVMAPLVGLVGAPIIAYAAVTEGETPGRPRLLALLTLFVGVMEGLVLAADFFTLLIAWELVGATSWALIAHDWRTGENAAAARTAFLVTRSGDLGLYLAAMSLFAATGGFAYTALPVLPAGYANAVAAGLLAAAAGKSAQLPFSPWLFAAMRGPTPVSALLHSAAMVAAGAFILARLAPALPQAGWLPAAVAGLGLATALAGSVVASLHDHIKRALAASTSAQYGLMLLAVGVGSSAAADVHLVNHAAFKALLFLGAGVAMHAAGSADLRKQRLGAALPATAALFAVGALALAAVPPLGGAYSKDAAAGAAMHAGAWLGAGALIVGFLSAFYAARLQILAYGPGKPRTVRRRPGPIELLSMGILATMVVVLSLLWIPGIRAALGTAFDGRLPAPIAGEVALSLALAGGGIGAAAALPPRAALGDVGLPDGLRAGLANWLGLPLAGRRLVERPVLALARALAGLDDRVVDAGIRVAAAMGRAGSRAAARWGEGGVDGAVEAAASGIERAGRRARRLQTGLTHQYYLIVVVGVAVAVVLLLFG